MSLAEFTQKPARTVGALNINDDSGVTPLGVITDRDLIWKLKPAMGRVAARRSNPA